MHEAESGWHAAPPSGALPVWQMPSSEQSPLQQSALVEQRPPTFTQAAAHAKPPSACGAQMRLQHWSEAAQASPSPRQLSLPQMPPSHSPAQRLIPADDSTQKELSGAQVFPRDPSQTSPAGASPARARQRPTPSSP